ncbi:hypothetical protein [Oryza sativa Japonica Group]|uniref:Uncharacterized protein n=1 Tax=Oryza sativa subsp. japonica TaxID=39947 RepID=Q657H0_ORYSJ|nr:hypothetical protein [Oryza sativa Japonica Group]
MCVVSFHHCYHRRALACTEAKLTVVKKPIIATPGRGASASHRLLLTFAVEIDSRALLVPIREALLSSALSRFGSARATIPPFLKQKRAKRFLLQGESVSFPFGGR